MSVSSLLLRVGRKTLDTVVAEDGPAHQSAMTEPRHQIINQTSRRISIEAKRNSSESLTIPPYGTRVAEEKQLSKFNFVEWEQMGLISIAPLTTAPKSKYPITSLILWMPLFLLSVYMLYWMLIKGADTIPYNRPIFVVLSAATLVAAAIKWRSFLNWISRSINYLLIFIIAVGLPLIFMALWPFYLLDRYFALNDLVDVILVALLVFISIASALPALLYYLFERQRSGTLRDSFFRDVVRLNPNVITVEDAKSLYGHLIDEILGPSLKGQISFGPSLPILLSTILIALAWCLSLLPTIYEIDQLNVLINELESSSPFTGRSLESIREINGKADEQVFALLFEPHRTPVSFGFLGAYFFAVNLVFRRYVRADLGPKTYTTILTRFLSTFILVWVTSELIPDDNSILITSFVIGIFPTLMLTLIQNFIRKAFGVVIPALREEHPLTNLEGVTLYDEARFMEEGIDNIENLAHHDLIDIMLRTRIPTNRLVDLVDQAVLYLHLHGFTGAEKRRKQFALKRLREYGIRTATDLEQAYSAAAERDRQVSFRKGEKKEVDRILGLLDPGAQIKHLQIVIDTLKDDEWMVYIRHWLSPEHFNGECYSIEMFTVPAGS